MLDFCAEHGVVSDVEIVGADQLNEAYDRMVAGDVKYRFVLDTSTLGHRRKGLTHEHAVHQDHQRVRSPGRFVWRETTSWRS